MRLLCKLTFILSFLGPESCAKCVTRTLGPGITPHFKDRNPDSQIREAAAEVKPAGRGAEPGPSAGWGPGARPLDVVPVRFCFTGHTSIITFRPTNTEDLNLFGGKSVIDTTMYD